MVRATLGIVVLVATLAGGCAFGPKAIEKTHGRYAETLLRVDEEQFLRNIVRVRYVEVPRSLDIASLATQYELTAAAEARPFFGTESVTGPFFMAFSQILPFVGASVANRPTVSMSPQDDGTTVRQFLTPISFDTLKMLVQSGWPVSTIMRIWIDRINGVPNFMPPNGPIRSAPPDYVRFLRICEILQHAQDAEWLSLVADEQAVQIGGTIPAEKVTPAAMIEATQNKLELRPKDNNGEWALIRLETKLFLHINPAGRHQPEIDELRQLLHLKPGLDAYEMQFASGVTDPEKNPIEPTTTIRFVPRSNAQAYFYLANGVEVPAVDVQCGLVRLPDGASPLEYTDGVFRVHSCAGHAHKRPDCAFAAIHHRGRWYYIDDRDQQSKSTLLLMMQLRRLDFKRQEISSVPSLTLPVGR